jgi:hypothetical protein
VSNEVKWSALGTFTTAIAGATTAPTLKNLASAGRKIGNSIDNSAPGVRNILSDWELKVTFAVAPAANAPVELYLIKAPDGANFEYGSDSIDPPPSALVGVFPCRAVSTVQRITLRGIVLPATVFQPFIYNKGGQAFTNVDNDSILSFIVYNEEIQ